MKIVLDTNVFLVCISSKSKYHPILTALRNRKISLCLSHEIQLEYEEIFEKHAGVLGKEFMLDALFNLPSLIVTNPRYKWELIEADHDDNKFVDCAIAASADFIITDDKHFEILKSIEFPIVKSLRAMSFIDEHLML